MSDTAKKVLAVFGVAALAAVSGYLVGMKTGAEMVCWADCECEKDCNGCCHGSDNQTKLDDQPEDDEPKTVEDLPGGETEE